MAHKTVVGSKVLTPAGRVSFPSVFKADNTGQYADGKYKLTLLVPKDDKGLADVKKMVLETARAAFGAKTKLSDIQHPFNDGDAKLEEQDEDGKSKYEAYGGSYYINLKNKYRPKVVDENVKEIIDPEDFYAGCWARCSVTPFSYLQGKNRGVSLRLGNIQKVKDDEKFGGGSSPEQDFSPVGAVDEDTPLDDDVDDV